jgi:peptide/nickel transport system substrate-binding protein
MSVRKKANVFLNLFIMIIMVCTVATSLYAGGETEKNAGEKEESILVITSPGELKVIDPIWTTGDPTRYHGFMVYDTLFSIDSKGLVQPQMVDSWTKSNDGLIYSFTLRDGLLWHDSTDVTASDCVMSLQRWSKRDAKGKLLAKYMKEMVVINTDTFEIRLNEPFGLVTEFLASPTGNVPFMMPERISKTPPEEQITEAIGSGPFKMTSFIPGDRAEYEKFELYNPRPEPADGLSGGKVVKVDKLIHRFIPDHSAQIAALKVGEVDFIQEPPAALIPSLEEDKNITIGIINTTGALQLLRPNHLHPPFNNVKARQALQYLVDQKKYMKIVVGDDRFYNECYSIYMSNSPLTTEVGSERLKEYNPEKAKQLFEEAGYNGELIVLLDPTNFDKHHKAIQITAEELRGIGLNVKVNPMAGPAFYEQRAITKSVSEGGWSLFHTDFPGSSMANPLDNPPLFSGNKPNDLSGWPGWPMNNKIEELKRQYAFAESLKDRQEIAVEIQQKRWSLLLM